MFDHQSIQRSVRDTQLNRRWFLAYASALSSIPLLARSSWANPNPRFVSDPFTLGVASGDPDSTSVVLWTRLAPKPLEPTGGMTREPVMVQWQLATDESMKSIVASGTSNATPQLGHSVHVEVSGLEPNRWYWYRFRAGDAESPIGRTRTMPAPDTMPDSIRFAVTSCQNYEQGLFTAYEQMAKDNLDLVLHLGDYIYEYEAGRNGKVRTHLGQEIKSLDDYRIRHSQYRMDPLLHGMHAACPWVLTWDDHEVDNNYADGVSEEKDVDPIDFLLRRANAYQAYYEMMPFRAQCLPKGPDMQLYRTISFGKLAEFLVLDTRQYRSDQPNNDKRSPINSEAMASSQTLLGREQKHWMYSELIASQAKWNVLTQQVMMGMVGGLSRDGVMSYSMDQWPGYAYERQAILKFLDERSIPNPVVLTGDIHSNWVNELRVDDRKPEEKLIATEFVATSLSSGGNGKEATTAMQTLMAANPCVKFHNEERGYIRCEVTPKTWRSDYMVVSDVLLPGGTTTPRRSFVVESGNPKVLDA
jgi:alkaline phosphatase D